MLNIPAEDDEGREIDLAAMPSFLLNHVAHRYRQTLQGRLRSVGVSALQMRIILSLKSVGSLTVSELCNWAIAEQSTMSRALDSLEAQGLVQRQSGEADSRLRLINLTDAGEALFDKIHPEISHVNQAMTAGMSRDERAALLAALKRVLMNLRNI